MIAVLWLLAFLTILAATALAITRNSGRLAQRAFESIQAEALADSGIRIALSELATSDVAKPLWIHGTNRTLNLFGNKIAVSTENEAGRIDLNAADENLLAAYFSADDHTSSGGHELARMILDFRQSHPIDIKTPEHSRDDRIRPGFRIVESFLQLSSSKALDSSTLAGLTIYTKAAVPRIEFASSKVWNAMVSIGYSAENVADGTASVGPDSTVSDSAQFKVGDVVRICSCAHIKKILACREAVSRITGNNAKPFQIFLWRHRTEAAPIGT